MHGGKARISLSCATCLLFGISAQADDLNGAWANDASVCGKVFVTGNASVSFTNTSDAYGIGFIIEGDRLKGKMVDCTINSRKQDGTTVHLIAACSTDVALSPTQFTLRIEGDNKITRVFPGIPEMDIAYFRCR